MLSGFLDTVFREDVLSVLRRVPDCSLDMVWGDPDYNVGIDYSGRKYTRKWKEYIDWYIELAKESMRVLKPEGNMFMMNYPKQNSWLRAGWLDENAFAVHDYVWVYNSNVGMSPRKLTTAHRSILHAVKSKGNKFFKEQISVPYQNPGDKRIQGRIASGSMGRMPYDWFYYDLVKNVSKDKTFHSCQIPLGLFEMFLKSCTVEGDSVFVLFGGSGGELVRARELGRRFVSCEIHPGYHGMILDRLASGGIKDEHRLPFFRKKPETDGARNP